MTKRTIPSQGGTKRLTTVIPSALYSSLKVIVAKRDETLMDIICRALKREVARNKEYL